MASVSAADLYPDSPEGKIKLVMDHNEVGNVGIGAPDDRADCPAAVVHIRLRLGQNDFLLSIRALPISALIFFLTDIHLQIFGEVHQQPRNPHCAACVRTFCPGCRARR